MAGPDHLVTTERLRAMDKLRRQQRILRTAVTRRLKTATELLEVASPHPHELQEAIDLLESRDTQLYEIDRYIIELLESDKVERHYFDGLAYRGGISLALNRLRNTLKVRKSSGMTVSTKIP